MNDNNASESPLLDLNLLVTLDALLGTGQVSRAAEILGVTQPAVSHALRKLRTHFADPLLVRAGRGLVLTPRAQELKSAVSRLVRDLHAALQPTAFDPGTATRTFTLSLSDIAEFVFLRDFLAAFREVAPHCRVRCLNVPAGDLPATLEAGRADVALGGLIPAMPPSLRQRRMFEYDHVCVARKGTVRGPLDRAAYAALPHVVVSRSGGFEDHIGRFLSRHRLHRRMVVSLSHNLVAAWLVSESDMVATLPRPAAERLARLFPIVAHELPLRAPRVVSRMYWHERVHDDPANRWLRQQLLAHFADDGA